MEIRLATKEDITSMVEIVCEHYGLETAEAAFKEFYFMFQNTPIKPEYFVAVENSKIIGLGGYSQSFINYYVYELCWINVKKDFRNRGIGEKIVLEIINRIKSFDGNDKAKFIILTAKNTKLYEKVGFKTLQSYIEPRQTSSNLMILDLLN